MQEHKKGAKVETKAIFVRQLSNGGHVPIDGAQMQFERREKFPSSSSRQVHAACFSVTSNTLSRARDINSYNVNGPLTARATAFIASNARLRLRRI